MGEVAKYVTGRRSFGELHFISVQKEIVCMLHASSDAGIVEEEAADKEDCESDRQRMAI